MLIPTNCPVCKCRYMTSDQVSKFKWYCSEVCEDSVNLKEDNKTDPEIRLKA